MGLLDGLRDWWQRQVGSGAEADGAEAADTDASADAAEPDGYECAICGTAVEAPDADCPVCRSGDIVPASGAASETDSGGAVARQYVEESDDDPVDRLQQVRDSSEILGEHEDRWEELDTGFRVETPDGEVTVTSRIEVAALLEKHYK